MYINRCESRGNINEMNISTMTVFEIQNMNYDISHALRKLYPEGPKFVQEGY